ncbi:MAG: glycosyltransferase family 2 protein, partial [Fibrobacterota bacterium]
MHKITAVVITYNEEDRIAQCINSLLPVADEIIVVDSYSTDTTAVLCKNTGVVRFIEHPFEGYGVQKNFGIEKASHDLILSLDADEVLSDSLIASIKALKNKSTLHDAYFCNRLNNYCGKWIRHGGWYPDRKLRLWDRRKGLWNNAPVHENVKLDAGASEGFLYGDILHYSYLSVSDHIRQLNNYTDLSAKQMILKGKRGRIGTALFRAIWK